MICRVILLSIRNLILVSSLIASTASAQTQALTNVFFKFDFILYPIAMKWCCGGQPDKDLSQIAVLTAAFPKDAERAELQNIVDALLLQTSKQRAGLSEMVGVELSNEQVERLCDAAQPLNIDWATPEQLATADADGVPREQKALWDAFFQVVEDVQLPQKELRP